ncbi:MAG TPA: DUF2442 domain-containing protein [Bacteroidetes bacterium]|nr:DUF2442 domain-containing protein [Bacteroidota bacterium]
MNQKIINIIEVKPLDNYSLYIKFEDGINGEINLKKNFITNGLSRDLLNEKIFKSVKIESGGGIVFENGYDLCPVTLRYIIENKNLTN